MRSQRQAKLHEPNWTNRLPNIKKVIELSGIVAILFTGMFTRHYAHPNLSVEGQVGKNYRYMAIMMYVCV